MKPSPWLIVVLVGAALGLVFAGLSTYDFVQHLDRQTHELHCSFIPGLKHTGVDSGCQVAMMSPYSSVFRTRIWGGVPISLPAMSVFAFIGFFAIDLLLSRRKDDRRATAFLALACGLPAVVSIVMLSIALTKLGTTCKLCIGIYVASATCLVGAIVQWRKASGATPNLPPMRVKSDRGDPAFTSKDPAAIGEAKGSKARLLEVGVDAPPASNGFLAAAFGVGIGFVLIPVLLYFALAPDHTKFIGTCDGLTKPEDPHGIMVAMAPSPGGAPTIEVLDPLCPACKGFEQRLEASGLADRLDRKAVLFPLAKPCNWMISQSTHPGACTVSEAVLCAGKRAPEVLEWAFAEQDKIREAARVKPEEAARMVHDRFPELDNCVGKPEVQARLGQSLRWAVNNNLKVLTPQVFIDNVKLCDEDVDLGLEYTLTNMLDRHDKKTLVRQTAESPEGGSR